MKICPKHGSDFIEYKCRFCCSVAVFFCFGTTHFCNPCHDAHSRCTRAKKEDMPQCPVSQERTAACCRLWLACVAQFPSNSSSRSLLIGWPLAFAYGALQCGPVLKQLEGSECPLHVVHPPTGEEFCLGCGVCRKAQTF